MTRPEILNAIASGEITPEDGEKLLADATTPVCKVTPKGVIHVSLRTARAAAGFPFTGDFKRMRAMGVALYPAEWIVLLANVPAITEAVEKHLETLKAASEEDSASE